MIRKAKNNENKILTEISFNSKKYWEYPDEYFEIWKNELTITPEYIKSNIVFVYEIDNNISAYYSIVHLKEELKINNITLAKGYWLEHMFVLQNFINQGIGKMLFNHMVEYCKTNQIPEIKILSDPNSKGFYEKMGCDYIEEYPSTIENRTTPYLIKQIL